MRRLGPIGRHRLLVAGIVAGAIVLAAAGPLAWYAETGSSPHASGHRAHRPATSTTGAPRTTTTTPPGAPSSTAAPASSTWTVYHGSPSGAGLGPPSPSFAAPSPAWTSAPLDGQVYGEPLVAFGRVFVATENDTLYALAADDGRVLWSTHLASPVPAGDVPCGDISPAVGITGTPVVDAARQELFAVADELADGTPSHHLVGVDLYSGKVLLDETVDPPGADPAAILQRTGLALYATRVVFGFGGNYGDCGTYHGWVVSLPLGGGSALRYEVDATSGERQGAVWMGGAAPEVGAGGLWVAVGNGSETSPSHYDGSDAVVELDPAMHVLQFFSPTDWFSDNAHDLDLGSTAPALLPDGLAVQAGKAGIAYLLRQVSLGGVGGQLATKPVCTGDGAYGGDAVTGTVVYLPCRSGLEAVTVDPSTGSMSLLWRAAAHPYGSPIVAGGLIWSVGGGTLYGIDPRTGATAVHLSVGTQANHFTTPATGDGLLLVSGGGGVHVVAFSGASGRPGPPPPASDSG